jgi:hypothetical protein
MNFLSPEEIAGQGERTKKRQRKSAWRRYFPEFRVLRSKPFNLKKFK